MVSRGSMEVKRDYYLNKLIRKIDNSMVKVIVGIKGCCISYLLNKLFYDYLIKNGISEDHIISVAMNTSINYCDFVFKNCPNVVCNAQKD